MPSGPRSFDELKLPFIFVPHGDPQPAEWLQNRIDVVKLPATLVSAAHGDNRPDHVPGAGMAVRYRSAGGQAASFDMAGPGTQAENAMADDTQATSDFTPGAYDPIAAFLQVSDVFGRPADPLAPPGATAASETNSADRTHADIGQAKDPMAPVPFVDDKGRPVLDREGKPILRPAGLDPI
jgi:hypothetical protein